VKRRGPFAHAFALASALVPACARTPDRAQPAAPPAAVAPAPAPARVPAPPSQAEGDARIAEALALVSEVRQLPIKNPVPGVRLDRVAIRAEVEKMLAQEAPPELVAGNTEMLFALDTVPSSFDLKSALGVLLGSQLAGFYDPDGKRMVLAADLGEDGERLTLYHELVHALQDQHYDLGDALDWKEELSDVQAALHCLGEGDATSAMVDVFARALGQPAQQIPPELLRMDSVLMQASPELASIPGVVTRSLIAPYADGLAFVNALRERFGGFSGVDQAWRERPLSTEHVLHVDKYLKREPVVPIPPLQPPPGFDGPPYRDVVGEQSLRLLFEEWVPARRAAESASDWGGDRIAVFQEGERRVVFWHLAFDTDAAAERATLALARGALRPELAPSPSSTAPAGRPAAPPGPPGGREFVDGDVARAKLRGGTLCQERPQRGAFAMARVGRHIGVTLGPYARTETGVRSAGTCPQALAWAKSIARQL
jgi:hypothetical protein